MHSRKASRAFLASVFPLHRVHKLRFAERYPKDRLAGTFSNEEWRKGVSIERGSVGEYRNEISGAFNTRSSPRN